MNPIQRQTPSDQTRALPIPVQAQHTLQPSKSPSAQPPENRPKDQIDAPIGSSKKGTAPLKFVDDSLSPPPFSVNMLNFEGLISEQNQDQFQTMTSELLALYHDDKAGFNQILNQLNEITNETSAQDYGFDLNAILSSNDSYPETLSLLGVDATQLGFDELKIFHEIFKPTAQFLTSENKNQRLKALFQLSEANHLGEVSPAYAQLMEGIVPYLTTEDQSTLDLYSGKFSDKASALHDKVQLIQDAMVHNTSLNPDNFSIKTNDITALDLFLGRLILPDQKTSSPQDIQKLGDVLKKFQGGTGLSPAEQQLLLSKGLKVEGRHIFALDKSGQAKQALGSNDIQQAFKMIQALSVAPAQRSADADAYLSAYKDVIIHTGLVNELSHQIKEQTSILRKLDSDIIQEETELSEVVVLLQDVDTLLERFSKDNLSAKDRSILTNLGIEVRPGKFVDNKFYHNGQLIKRKDIVQHLRQRQQSLVQTIAQNKDRKRTIQTDLTHNQGQLAANLLHLSDKENQLITAFHNLSPDNQNRFNPVHQMIIQDIGQARRAGLESLLNSALALGNQRDFESILDMPTGPPETEVKTEKETAKSHSDLFLTHTHLDDTLKSQTKQNEKIATEMRQLTHKNRAKIAAAKIAQAQLTDQNMAENHLDKSNKILAENSKRFKQDQALQAKQLEAIKKTTD